MQPGGGPTPARPSTSFCEPDGTPDPTARGRPARFVDQVPGIGGLALAALSAALLLFRIEIDGDPETITSILSVSMLSWLTAITSRHRRAHPDGPGTGLLHGAWAVVDLMGRLSNPPEPLDSLAGRGIARSLVPDALPDDRAGGIGRPAFGPQVLGDHVLADLDPEGPKPDVGRRVRLA
jgi:hypothetical protein